MKSYLADNLSISAGINAKASGSISAVATTGSTPRDYKIARVFTVTDAEGSTTTYLYSYDRTALKYTVTQKFPGGRQVTSVYDREGWLLQKTIGQRLVYTMVRDGDRVELITDERGLTTRVEYDGARNPIKITYPDGTNVTTTYDNVYSNPLTRLDEIGTLTNYQYDIKGNLLTLTEAVGSPEQSVTTYLYDAYGQQTAISRKGPTPPEDAVATLAYDTYGNATTKKDALNNPTQYTYNVLGNAVSRLDARGNNWSVSYNAKGWLVSQADPLGNTRSYGYDRVGNPISATDAASNRTSFAYDKTNRMIGITDPMGGITKFQYDQEGRGTKYIDPSGVARSYVYDPDGRLVETVDGNGNVTQTVYGSDSDGLNGLVSNVVFPTFTAQYKYDQRNRVTQIVQLLDQSTRYTTSRGYDGIGNLLSETDPSGRSTFIGYDGLGRRTSLTDALGGVTQYHYDSRDNIIEIVDAKGTPNRYKYDLVNRKIQETRPSGLSTSYEFDANGNLVTRTNAKGEQQQYKYDLADRRIQEQQFAVTNGSLDLIASRTVTYVYDARNFVVGYDDGSTSAAYTFDANGRKTQESVNFGTFSKTYQYSYQANGSKSGFQYPDGSQLTYSYDPNNQLMAISGAFGTIGYGAYMWMAPTQVTVPGVTKTLTYDAIMRTAEIKAQANGAGAPGNPQGAVFMDYRYRYDGASNVTQRTTEEGDYQYQYDNLDRLIGAVPPAVLQVSAANPNGLPLEGYSYDALYNRVASIHQPGSWIYDVDNQLLQYGQGQEQTTFQYDTNGQTQNRISSSINRSYRYDVKERLVEILDGAGITLAQYYYDPWGRRLKKVAGGVVTYFQYSEEGLIAEYDATGTLSIAYGWQPDGSWGRNPQFKRESGQFAFYQNDHLGTPQKLSDLTGGVVWSSKSDAFGNAQIDVEVVANPLRLPGQYFDAETGTQYNFFRDYDPRTGRYLQVDPMGRTASPNAYDYADANPIGNDDIFGLQPRFTYPRGNFQIPRTPPPYNFPGNPPRRPPTFPPPSWYPKPRFHDPYKELPDRSDPCDPLLGCPHYPVEPDPYGMRCWWDCPPEHTCDVKHPSGYCTKKCVREEYIPPLPPEPINPPGL